MRITNRWPNVSRYVTRRPVRIPTLPFLIATLCAPALTSRGDTLRPLAASHIAPGLAQAQLVGHMPVTQTLRFTVALPVRNQTSLDQLIVDQNDPRSPRYMFYLTPEQFGEQFGATRADYDQTIAFLTAQGFKVARTYSNRLHIGVEGTVQQVEQTFGVRMNRYRIGDRECYATDRNPSAPAGLRVPLSG